MIIGREKLPLYIDERSMTPFFLRSVATQSGTMKPQDGFANLILCDSSLALQICIVFLILYPGIIVAFWHYHEKAMASDVI